MRKFLILLCLAAATVLLWLATKPAAPAEATADAPSSAEEAPSQSVAANG
jgi:hypothetical protein